VTMAQARAMAEETWQLQRWVLLSLGKNCWPSRVRGVGVTHCAQGWWEPGEAAWRSFFLPSGVGGVGARFFMSLNRTHMAGGRAPRDRLALSSCKHGFQGLEQPSGKPWVERRV
jgi:hypothetical protein